MLYEFTLPLSRPLRDVIPLAPGAPLPQASLSPEQLQAQRDADRQAERQAAERVLGGITRSVQELHARQQELVADVQKATVELALAVASWLVRKKVEAGEYPLEAVIREALERLGPQRPVTVCLHPDDLRLLEGRIARPLFPPGAEVSASADPTVARGDCRVQAGDVEVLSHLDEHLAAVRHSMLRELDHASTASSSAAKSGDRTRPT